MIELAGDRAVMETTHDGTTTISFGDKGTGRVCGACTLCCKLLPVPEIVKPAGKRCHHQRMGGCKIYLHRPTSCRVFSCRWLIEPETAGLSRPDRSHYVIDMTEDYVTAFAPDSAERVMIPVLQVWVDPAVRDAHRDPDLRAYLSRMKEKHGLAAIVRWSSTDAVTLFPPGFADNVDWVEVPGTIGPRNALEAAILNEFKPESVDER